MSYPSPPNRRQGRDRRQGNPHTFTAPYGIAFAIADLQQAMAWARIHRMALAVVLDHVRGGAEFEELLVLTAPPRGLGGRARFVHLWRTSTQVFAQSQGSTPAGFAHLAAALDAHAHAAPSRNGLLGLFRVKAHHG